ncbi:MAG: HAD hydrolase family protein [Bacteroidales bacterium]|nr:HAD hydrolase family protein [Bacteroidales bacterium]
MAYQEKLKKIKAFAFDVDGVLSQGFLAMPDGEMLRMMNCRDGYIIRQALNMNIPVAIITRGESASVKLRFTKLGITDYYGFQHEKTDSLKDFAAKYGLDTSQVLYMGDDIPDVGCIEMAGLGCCPADACDEAIAVADYVSTKDGGMGCVRQVMEMVLRAQGVWPPK